MYLKSLTSFFLVAVFVFIMYIVYTGSISTYDLVTGALAGIVVAALFSGITIKNPAKVLNPIRWFYATAYAVKYFFYYETMAHVDVIKRILHPKVPVMPAIVEAPYTVTSDYAITAVACSITNTPGTVVVEVDEKRKVFYIHWIYAVTLEPMEAKKHIFEDFEKYAKKIFD